LLWGAIWTAGTIVGFFTGPRPSITGERRVEISGRAKSDSLLGDQEAVCLQVVAGARNHMNSTQSVIRSGLISFCSAFGFFGPAEPSSPKRNRQGGSNSRPPASRQSEFLPNSTATLLKRFYMSLRSRLTQGADVFCGKAASDRPSSRALRLDSG